MLNAKFFVINLLTDVLFIPVFYFKRWKFMRAGVAFEWLILLASVSIFTAIGEK